MMVRVGVDVEQGRTGSGGERCDDVGPASLADVDHALQHRASLSARRSTAVQAFVTHAEVG